MLVEECFSSGQNTFRESKFDVLVDVAVQQGRNIVGRLFGGDLWLMRAISKTSLNYGGVSEYCANLGSVAETIFSRFQERKQNDGRTMETMGSTSESRAS